MKRRNSGKLCAAFAGGGTGGHIYPGLAVADALKGVCDCTVVWLGSSAGMDKNLVEKSGSCDRFVGIPSGKLRRYFSLQNFFDVFKIAAGCIKAFFVLLRLKPDFLFSKGGFVSVPPCFAAKLLRIKVYTHECDFSPGLATRLNARFASRILVSYGETADFFPQAKRACITVTGNPVRPVFFAADAQKGAEFLGLSKGAKPVLLVLGGSGGAKQINELVWQNLEWLCERFVVVHQTGASQGEGAAARLADVRVQELSAQKRYLPYAFIYAEMPHVLAFADLVFSRAGANSLWEAAATAKPMLLLPLEGGGTRGDQVENAEYFEKRGAALVIRGGEGEAQAMKGALLQMEDAAFRARLSQGAAQLLGGKNPARLIADTLLEENRARSSG